MLGFLLVPRSEAGGAVVVGAFMEGAGPKGVYNRRAGGSEAPPPNNRRLALCLQPLAKAEVLPGQGDSQSLRGGAKRTGWGRGGGGGHELKRGWALGPL